MAHDVDDVFKDFEQKVGGKKESKSRKHAEKDSGKEEKELSEEERLKQKYQEKKQALKEKYREQMQKIQEKKHEEGSTTHMEWVERAAYIAVIIVLIGYIGVDLAFYHNNPVEEANPAGVTADNEVANTQAAAADNTTKESKKQKEEAKETGGTAESAENKSEAKQEAGEAEEKLALSGKVTLTMGKVYTSISDFSDDVGYIERVVFTIKNGEDETITPFVNVYAYDENLKEDWEDRSRGEYKGIPLEPGEETTGSISLTPKTFRDLDEEKTVRLELNESNDGFLTQTSDDVLIE